MGSAEKQSALWGARPRDWAEIQEGVVAPMFARLLERANVTAGKAVLDDGCGAGQLAQMAAARGATVTGFDATAALIEIARERVPNGDFRVGDMEALPFNDHSFDAVIGCNSFQYAARPIRALEEARRVARPGSVVIMAVWGNPRDTEAAGYLKALGSLLPPPPPGAPGPFALSEEGALESLMREAGLEPSSPEEVDTTWEYRDEATALRGLLAAGPAVAAIQHAGEAAVRGAVAKSLEPFRQPDGSYRLRNRFRYIVAKAPASRSA